MRFPPEGLSLKWYGRFFENDGFMGALDLSLQVAFVTTIVSVFLGTTAALCHRRLGRHWRSGYRLILLLPILLPELLTAMGLLFFLYQIGLGKSLFGLQIGHIIVTMPLTFLSVSAALQQVDPSLEEASDSLGAGSLHTFRHVLLPLIQAGIVSGALFAFVTSFDLFTISFLLKPIGGNTLPLAMFDFLTYDFDPTAAAAATISILMAILGVLTIDRAIGLRNIV